MARMKNRGYSKIGTAPKEVRETVEAMIESGSYRYSEIIAYMATQGISISKGAVSNYARGFQESIDAMRITHQNYEYMRAEVERHPDFDMMEVLLRVATQNLLSALMNKPEEAWDGVGVEKVVSQISALANAFAYKRRTESQNKGKYEAAADEVRVEMWRTLADKHPDLFRAASTELKRIQKEGDGHGR